MNRDELSVYADQLQIEGDIRGEIIALELSPPRPELEARRDALMQKWLGFDPRGMTGVRFRYGFVDLRASQLERVLSTAAAPFIRSVWVEGGSSDVVQTLRRLAREPRRWLTRLSIATGGRFTVRRGPRAQFLIDDALAGALVAATPALAYLDVTGHRVMSQFPHPHVRRLRIVGYDAIGALVDAGPAMPAVTELAYAFAHDPDGRIVFADTGLPRTLLARQTLPALASLDLSRNELQRSWSDRHVMLFELLGELGVVPQLQHLRVPPVHDDTERAALDHARAITAATIEIADGQLDPVHDLHDPTSTIGVRVNDREHRISLARLAELATARWIDLDETTRDAWLALWRTLVELPLVAEYDWEGVQVPAPQLPLPLFATPLASLGGAVEDDFAISELAAACLVAREPRVATRRYGY